MPVDGNGKSLKGIEKQKDATFENMRGKDKNINQAIV